jgi:CBS domain-containing protein
MGRIDQEVITVGHKVRDVMTPGVQSVRVTDTAVDAARLMRDNDIGSLPVVSEMNEPVGMVTDRDVAIRVVAENRPANAVQVGEVFSARPVMVDPEESLDDALQLMAQHKVRRLPVVEQGRLIGMIAQADIALSESAKKTGELVEHISEPTSISRESVPSR